MSEVIARASDVSCWFGNGPAQVVAVRNATLEIPSAQLTLIVGPSGSGKTTLLSAIGGLIAPSAGTIEIEGRVLSQMLRAELDNFRLCRLGFVFQTFRLLDALSVVENVELPMNLAGVWKPQSRTAATELLTRFHLEHRLHASPRTLSGGEKQRVAIARALANDPRLLLADEPTGSLDSHAGQEVIELLHAVARDRGTAVLVVSHDPRIRPYADSIFEIEDGVLRQLSADREVSPSGEAKPPALSS